MHLVTVASYSETWRAQLAQAKLEREGIRACVADEQITNLHFWYRYATGGAKVQVAAENADAARRILQEESEGEETSEPAATESLAAARCPRCGSARREREPPSRWFAIVTFLAFGLPLLLRGVRWICRQCGHKWEDE